MLKFHVYTKRPCRFSTKFDWLGFARFGAAGTGMWSAAGRTEVRQSSSRELFELSGVMVTCTCMVTDALPDRGSGVAAWCLMLRQTVV